jgi:2-C-methyl-D-erythritol 4-phosphate cytidylyltransferase
LPVLPQGRQTEALESEDRKLSDSALMGATMVDDHLEVIPDGDEPVVDAQVVGVKVVVDEDLAAYNRYLADLNRSDPPKRW